MYKDIDTKERAEDRRRNAPPNRLKSSILETIGQTPTVKLNKVGPAEANIFVKLEAFNPMGSIKDRMALAVIEAAEQSGDLQPGQTVIEASSGNTGIGLAMVCAQKGYPLVIVMGENLSLERRRLQRFLGAKVVLTSASARATGMFRVAEALAEEHGWFFCRQFENEANATAHQDTTGLEILLDFADRRLDAWVSGFGTGGTLKGTARALKLASPKTEIVAVEPENSALLSSGIEQLRRADGAASRSHPNARAHPIQGWSPDFIPKLAEDAMAKGLIDRIQPVSGADALRVTRDLARREGIFCGISGGATVAAALAFAETAPAGANILAMVPDTGERYLSTLLFDSVSDEMSAEEDAILSSVEIAAPKPARASVAPISRPAVEFIAKTLADRDAPIVMFGFEWCEFCWSVRRLFDRADVPFRSIDVDSAEFRQNDWGGEVLRALFTHTGLRTVPQVFVAGELVGGATEVLSEFSRGTLQARLADLPKPIAAGPVEDPMGLLPNWIRKPAVKPRKTAK
ncbi:MAG: pyridoxal-phosphate dependent enzyme [Pseudomonadota bacterium]